MDTISIVSAVITLSIAAASFVIAYRHSKEKGFVWNNAYIYASKEEREERDWKAEYKQSKVVFVMIGIMFSIFTVEIITGWDWLMFVGIGLAVIAIIYAIASSMNGKKSA